MNSIILCEGESDQILLSYYLQNQYGWVYDKLSENKLKKINPSSSSESICSYKKNTHCLNIWAVGGKENFVKALNSILFNNKINDLKHLFSEKIVVMTDNDSSQEVLKLTEDMNNVFLEYKIDVKLEEQKWVKGQQNIDLEVEPKLLQVLELIVPPDGKGAIETFLLDVLSEQDENKYIANEAKKFIDKMLDNKKEYNDIYLSSRRLKTKAPLAVFFAVVSPEYSFKEKDDILKSIPWQNYLKFQKLFDLFSVISA